MATTADLSRSAGGTATAGAAVDWYFHLLLWLRAPSCGEMLWAYNARHLDFIETFVAATLREHQRGEQGWSNQSVRNRLPGWMKRAENRGAILKCIERLKDRLPVEQ